MNNKFWMGILVFPFLFQCTGKSSIENYQFETLDSLQFNSTLIELGEKLFFDPRLSFDNSISCATCHKPELAFSDGEKTSIGIHQRSGKRNTPSIWNVKNQDRFMWDGGVKTLELQAIVPLQDSNEMGGLITDLFPKLSKVKLYDSVSKVLYNKEFDPYVLVQALSAYQRSLYQENSKFDEWKNNSKLEDSILARGFYLFDEVLNCTKCHSGNTFTNNSMENNGLYLVYKDEGHFNISFDSLDIGKFKVPSLRNVSVTAPYMHDGSLDNLYEVIQHYESGAKNHPNKSKEIQPFTLTKQEREDLIYFLESLSDRRFTN